ncbi:L-type lectin-domain containing receptor kinase IV.1-like [Iris pallida]|uniref:non-specific serine/threonine protein kinase n=1 Tax=Iris pallida TaxID=29817 RepID=A0AAX6E573_IRIPA|nr:L-type lectin-domain containing receptor kinase IV.1-like [Iris pallida]
MVHALLLLSSLAIIAHLAVASTSGSFVFNGFRGADLSVDGVSSIDPGGLLLLTNDTKLAMGHAFFPAPFDFVNSSTGSPLSFSTTFVFAIVPSVADVKSHGLAFVVSPSKNFKGAHPSQYLGLFNLTSNGDPTNRILAVELDTVQNIEYDDIDDNHVGIDVNSLRSVNSAPASYAVAGSPRGREFKNLSLTSGQPMRLWVDYDGREMRLDVTLSPADVPKPPTPLLSSKLNLSSFLGAGGMYVGFSAANGGVTATNYVLGWSFSLNGRAKELDAVSKLPSLPHVERADRRLRMWRVMLPVGFSVSLLLSIIVVGLALLIRSTVKYSEVREDWELEYGPHRISYKDLYRATRGFRDENMLGEGGFGSVYRGVLPGSNLEIAVKRVSNESKQGMKEFVAEIVSIGRVRHRNLVQLLGYSRRRGELLLVYDYMPNGSLDRYLFNRPEVLLGWSQRFRAIKGIAAGLLYLHEEWEQVVLHRDIKASNVLLDGDFNARLGDFGLARLYDHGSNVQATHVVGTLGYIAPELSRRGKATVNSDVYGFGAFVLEVACGRRPYEIKPSGEEMDLVEWVLEFSKRGEIVEARDRRLRDDYVAEEVELALRLGLLCSHPVATSRPSMRQVVQYLNGDVPVPGLSEEDVQVFGSMNPNKISALCRSVACDPVDGAQSSGDELPLPETTRLSGGR